MFWKTAVVETDSLHAALEKEDVKLEEILEDPFVIQEAKNDNAKLMGFLGSHVVAMLQHALGEPGGEAEDRERFRHASVSAELLSLPSDALSKALFDSPDARTALATFLTGKDPDQLNPLSASFYSKILTQLLSRSPSDGEVVGLVTGMEGLVGDLLRHLGTSAVTDVLFRLVSVPEEEEDTYAIKEHLVKEGLVAGLVAAFHPVRGPLDAENAALVWNELVRTLRDLQYNRDEKTHDPLLAALQGREALAGLTAAMFSPEGRACDAVLEAGSRVFSNLLQTVYVQANPWELAQKAEVEVAEEGAEATVSGEGLPAVASDPSLSPLRRRQTSGSSAKEEREEIWTPDPDHVVESCLAETLEELTKVLATSPGTEAPLAMGKVQALGSGRLYLVKLVAHLLNTNHSAVQTKAAQLGLMRSLLELLPKFPWNNLLHFSVAQAVACVLFAQHRESEGGEAGKEPHRALVKSLLVDGGLLQLILKHATWESEPAKAGRDGNTELRAHLFEMAKWLQVARAKSPNAALIEEAMGALGAETAEAWEVFRLGRLKEFLGANEPDEAECGDRPKANAAFYADIDKGELHQADLHIKRLAQQEEKWGLGGPDLPSPDDFRKGIADLPPDGPISSDFPPGTQICMDIGGESPMPPDPVLPAFPVPERLAFKPEEEFAALCSQRMGELPGSGPKLPETPPNAFDDPFGGASGGSSSEGWANFDSAPSKSDSGDWPAAPQASGSSGSGGSFAADFSVFGESSAASAGLAAATVGDPDWDPFAAPAPTAPKPRIPSPPKGPPPPPPTQPPDAKS